VAEPTPLKNDGVRQLGLLFPIYGSHNPFMFQTTNQIGTKSKITVALGPNLMGTEWWACYDHRHCHQQHHDQHRHRQESS